MLRNHMQRLRFINILRVQQAEEGLGQNTTTFLLYSRLSTLNRIL